MHPLKPRELRTKRGDILLTSGPKNRKLHGICSRPGFLDLKRPVVVATVFGTKLRTAASTALHEILHGVSFLYDIGLTEKQVRRLEKGLGSLMAKNQKFIRTLSEAL